VCKNFSLDVGVIWREVDMARINSPAIDFWEKQLTSNTGTSKKKGNIESMLTKIENGNGPPMGWGGGVTADDDRGCCDPVDPV
jgi:hypothetical protein